MKILICEPQKHPRRADIYDTLQAMQEVVGGLIEAVYPWDDPVALVCDEDGLFKDTEWNRYISKDVQIKGTFFICGLTEDDFGDLSDELMEKYEKMLWCPQKRIYDREGKAWFIYIKAKEEEHDEQSRATSGTL